MSREIFLESLSKQFYPELRKQGFKGSGNTLRKIDGELIHVFNIQGSIYGAQCYINLGAHLSFLPWRGDKPFDPKKIKEYECCFRGRLDPPDSASGWTYGSSESERNRRIDQIIDLYNTRGTLFFKEFAKYPDSFTSITPASLLPGDRPHHLGSASPLTWALIALQLGNLENAKAFARFGLERAPSRATDWKKQYQNILDQH